MPNRYLNKNIALPTDHGSWVFLLSPLLIGIFAGRKFFAAHGWLIIALLAIFFLRQPASMLVKTVSGRRAKNDQPVAILWIMVYGLICLIGAIGLFSQGAGFIFWLAPAGLLVFGWHLWLVSKRQERRQMGVDVLASGILALSAPAAFWISTNGPHLIGWWLWLLVWLQSAASIVYAFLRLEQRVLKEEPSQEVLWQMGRRSLIYTGFNLALTLVGGFAGWLSAWIWVPYLLQFTEVIWGTLRPSIGWKPTTIGFRQLAVSSLFTLLFILLW